jgi:hypothetical protein
MSVTIVILQPMFIPWLGLFEQIRLSDIYVHYDDVQLPQGRSFTTRVQIKTSAGITWLTAPVDRTHSGSMINETYLVQDNNWRIKHLKSLKQWYARAPFVDTMMEIANQIYDFDSNNLALFNRHAIELISAWLGLKTRFSSASALGIGGSSTGRLVDICQYYKADTYVTGLGALHYLDYERFERCGISVKYMDYEKRTYPQLHGTFTPFVSILDTIANCGRKTEELIQSGAIYWKDFLLRGQ